LDSGKSSASLSDKLSLLKTYSLISCILFKLMTAMFQNLFPPINVETINLRDCRRIVLFNYDADSKIVTFRQYTINAAPTGISKATRRVIRAKIPNLNKMQDISEYVFKSDNLSDSEAEDLPESKVLLPQNYVGRGNRREHKSAIRLKEIGPRMTLVLIKIEEEFCSGRVLFHQFVQKTREEIALLKKKTKVQEELDKKARKLQQQKNVKRKQGQENEGSNATGSSEQDEIIPDVDDTPTQPAQKKLKVNSLAPTKSTPTPIDDVDCELLMAKKLQSRKKRKQLKKAEHSNSGDQPKKESEQRVVWPTKGEVILPEKKTIKQSNKTIKQSNKTIKQSNKTNKTHSTKQDRYSGLKNKSKRKNK